MRGVWLSYLERAMKHDERLVAAVARALAEASGYDPDQLMIDTRARFRRLAVAALDAMTEDGERDAAIEAAHRPQ